ncbi:MAG: biotin/lipoyl-binding carrier protein [Sneathiella sp.]|uniref:biotin/lipoyl-binding carrier protein n=1 Tax=Sneathiella sp. TaxID=1964365 RepID=UPI0030029931
MALVDVISEITGKVWKIEAAIGEKLEEDDPVIVLESMKMEIPILAPDDGTIAEILVGEGDPVKEGQVIARMQA